MDIFQNKLVHITFVPISFQGKATVVPFSVFFYCMRKINSFRAGMFVSESNINFNQFWRFQDRSIIHGGFHRGLSDNRIKVFLREATSLERNVTDCPSPVIIFCLHFLTLLHVWAVWEYFHLLDNTPRENVDVLGKLVGVQII